jgi:uncharacterized protein YciI
MKFYYILLLALFCCCSLNAQNPNPKYDEALATKHGADEYGMKTYILVMLTTGPNESEDSEHRDKSFAGHMENMGTMVKEGKLVVSGPFLKNDKGYRGLFILNVDNIKDAEEVLSSDPAIKAGYLAYEMLPWYGSAALPEYLEASEKVSKVEW